MIEFSADIPDPASSGVSQDDRKGFRRRVAIGEMPKTLNGLHRPKPIPVRYV